MKKSFIVQRNVLFFLLLINFFAQIVYFQHQYYRGTGSFLTHILGIIIMLVVFVCFIVSYLRLIQGKRYGYLMFLLFLITEFVFYLFNSILTTIVGNGPFFQLFNHDLVLQVIFAIGYMNLFASGYFILLLVYAKKQKAI